MTPECTTLLDTAPFEWQTTVDCLSMAQRQALRRELEGLAERAATLAAYLDERHGYGNGDRGHVPAMKAANRVGRLLWCRGFGYNDYHKLTV